MVQARLEYEQLFSILDGMHHDSDRRFWIETMEASENMCGIKADTGKIVTGVDIVFQMIHNALNKSKENLQLGIAL